MKHVFLSIAIFFCMSLVVTQLEYPLCAQEDSDQTEMNIGNDNNNSDAVDMGTIEQESDNPEAMDMETIEQESDNPEAMDMETIEQESDDTKSEMEEIN
jgi:hypothetical protein